MLTGAPRTYLYVMPRDDSSKTFSLLCHSGVVSALLCNDAGFGTSSSATSASSSTSTFLFPMAVLDAEPLKTGQLVRVAVYSVLER